jgi:predicted RNA-binding protein with PIN domain
MKYQLLIIDGYNLIHQDEELKQFLDHSLEGARKQLVNKVAHIAPLLAKKCVIVFDGKGSSRGIQRAKEDTVEIIFSPGNKTADAIIERITYCSMKPEKICVVTDDHAEQITIMSAGAFTMSCREFMLNSSDNEIRARSYQKRQSLKPRGSRLGDFFPKD